MKECNGKSSRIFDENKWESDRLVQKYINTNFNYDLENLMKYSYYKGKHFWTVAFDNFKNNVETLKVMGDYWFEYEFIQLNFTLDKIEELGRGVDSEKNVELGVYVDYLKLKIIELLYKIEIEKEA